MKYYSETLKQLFDSEEAVKTAEEEHAIALKNKEELEAQQKAELSKQKKELADKIDKAKAAYDEAYDAFDRSKGQSPTPISACLPASARSAALACSW